MSLDEKRRSSYYRSNSRPSKFKSKRRQTFHSGHHQRRSLLPMHFEVAEVFEKPVSNLTVPRIIPHRSYAATSQDISHTQSQKPQVRYTRRKIFLLHYLHNVIPRKHSIKSHSNQVSLLRETK